jgi:hypothetical protein
MRSNTLYEERKESDLYFKKNDNNLTFHKNQEENKENS